VNDVHAFISVGLFVKILVSIRYSVADGAKHLALSTYENT
jgi:hypothetical protein